MIPPLFVGACITVGAGKTHPFYILALPVSLISSSFLKKDIGLLCLLVWRRTRRRRQNHLSSTSVEVSFFILVLDRSGTGLQDNPQADLHQLFEIASNQPQLLWTNPLRMKIQRVTRRINEANEPVPWQLAYIYRQMETTVDSLSYDEMYELFGGNPAPPGLTLEESNSVETFLFEPEENYHKTDLNSDEMRCPICLEMYKKGDELMALPNCRHCYHAKCVLQWLRFRGDCPICRRRIKDEIKSQNCKKQAAFLQ